MLPRVLALPGLLLFISAASAAAPPTTRPIDFTRDVQPLLQRYCVRCHGPEKQRGGLRLDDGTLAMQGGNSGAVIRPGDSRRSRLVHLVAGLDPDMRMPPGKGKELPADQVALLRAWIDQGAGWPKGTTAVAGTVRSRHWSFQPVRRPALPAVRNAAWPRNAIDAFVLARLEKEKLAPSPEADRITLLRRLSFDLTGLPPTVEEVDRFLADTRPGAWERVVERLLASPGYGERWGRHWLDVARYADSDGYEKDTGRPFAWRYRHWVIAALNADLPFDRFTIEQLAGDLLPGATTEQKVATGFHRNTLTNREGGVDQEQFRVEAVVDRVNTTGRAWLGLTIGCAQCHDHKYDPLSQRDYYQLFAFFNSDVEKDIPAPLPGTPGPSPARQKELADLAAREKARRKALDARLASWEKALTPQQKKALPARVRAILAVAPGKRSAKQTQALLAFHAAGDAELAKLTKQIAELRKAMPPVVLAQALALGRPRRTHVLIRGDFLRPGVEVRPGFPAVLASAGAASPVFHPSPRFGRERGASRALTRLDLARWLVSPVNPLTPRVTVNWVWQKFFGRGLVATPEDFGTQGEKPSHPDLLDWLAHEFVRQGWGLKDLHRLIVTSSTYRQSSARPGRGSTPAHERDPANVLLARQARQRLEAEVIRDTALAASGLLVRTIGGPSVRPPQPAGISELTYAGSARWLESTGADRYRRGLYTWFQRTSPYPMLLTFDAPDSTLCCVKRERSNTPLQALTLLNDAVFVECAGALARRVLRRHGSDTAAGLRYAFRLCTARPPTPGELQCLKQLHAELLALCESDPRGAAELVGKERTEGQSVPLTAAWVAVARAILNLDEVVTRE